MKDTFKYQAFGLNFISEFEIPEFVPVQSDMNDIFIKQGFVPENITNAQKEGVRFQARNNEFLLNVDGLARYYIRNGNEIIVQTSKKQIDKEVRLFLLGSALGALFIQRGLLPVHGSAIKTGDSACIFSGLSGVGKSSIIAGFIQKGFKFLADDISLINKDLNIVPGFPFLKVWDDVLQELKIESNSLNQVRPGIKKYHLPVDNNFYIEPLPVDKIFILTVKNTPGFEYEEIKGIAKFNVLRNNTYRYRFISGLDKQKDHFSVLNKLIAKTKVYRVSRPQNPMQLNEFVQYFTESFNLDV